MIEKTRKILTELGVDARIAEHLEIDGSKSENASLALGIPVSSVIKCLILKSKKAKFVAAILLGNQRLDIRKLEGVSNLKKLSLASESSIETETGFKAGGVPPFAVIGVMPLFVDSSVLKKEEVLGSAGTPFHGLFFNPAIFKTLDCTIMNISMTS